MNQHIANDLSVSHSLLSFLFAGFQGSYAAMKIQGRFQPEKFNDDTLKSYDRILTRTFNLLNDVYSGTPLISESWNEIETFEASSAFGDLERLKNDLLATITELVPICIKVKTQPGRVTLEEAKVLLQEYGRLLYSKDYYLRCQVQYAQLFQLRDMFDEVFPNSAQAQADLIHFDEISNQFEDKSPSRQTLDELYKTTEDLPMAFSVQAHEISLLSNFYTRPLTYTALEIQAEEATVWESLKISPQDAGYWRAHLISPDIADNWNKLGVTEPSTAYQWEKNGFNPSDAKEWVDEGFSPDIASTWKNAKYTPAETAENIKNGIQDPKQVKKNLVQPTSKPVKPPGSRGTLRLK